ncbi:MAG: DUF1385 domain-containing protein [Actinobacteria bacterium]|nr:DUF1385 domain-containing protein [Actinomycetota bacterium]
MRYQPGGEARRQTHLKIGGMALDNGVLFQSERHWSMAVRTETGIEVSSGEKTALSRSHLKKIPLLRGLISLTESAAILPEAHAHGGRMPAMMRSPQVLASVLLSTVATAALRNPKKRLPPLVEEAVMAGLAMLPSLIALRGTGVTQYHAAEHKSINSYESAGLVDEESAQAARAEHARCGSNIIGPALALMTVGNALSRRALGRQSQAARLGIGLLSLSGAIEMIQWAARNPGSLWSRLLTWSGNSLQTLVTTKEPTDDQLEVGLAALSELLRVEGVGSA